MKREQVPPPEDTRCWACSATGLRCERPRGHYADALSLAPSPHRADGVEWFGIAKAAWAKSPIAAYRGEATGMYASLLIGGVTGEGSRRR